MAVVLRVTVVSCKADWKGGFCDVEVGLMRGCVPWLISFYGLENLALKSRREIEVESE